MIRNSIRNADGSFQVKTQFGRTEPKFEPLGDGLFLFKQGIEEKVSPFLSSFQVFLKLQKLNK